MSELIVDSILTKAFSEYNAKTLSSYPADEEMKKMYPVSDKMIKLYDRLAKARDNGKRKTRNIIQIILVASIIAALLICTVVAVSEPIRERIKYKISRDDKSIEYSTEWAPLPQDKPDFFYYQVGYIPEGFELDHENTSRAGRELVYYKGDLYIIVTIYDLPSVSTFVSPEYSSYTVKMICGRESHIYYYDSENCGIILMFGNDVGITITGYCSKEELVKIAENIK